MRVGDLDRTHSVYRRVWEQISADLCEPVIYVSEKDWTRINGSDIDTLRFGNIVDTYDIFWAATHRRRGVVNFSYPIRPNEQIFRVPSDRAIVDKLHILDGADPAVSVFSADIWIAVISVLVLLLICNSRYAMQALHSGDLLYVLLSILELLSNFDINVHKKPKKSMQNNFIHNLLR